MTNKELIKYCLCILIMVAISTFMVNLISNPGEYLAKLQNVSAIRGYSNYQYKTYGQKPVVSFPVEDLDVAFLKQESKNKINNLLYYLGAMDYYNYFEKNNELRYK